MKIDINKGRYWDRPWSLVDGCTPCSPGCERCWSAAMAHRFHPEPYTIQMVGGPPAFMGTVTPRPDRLDIPLRTRKPTVWAVWNDLFHENVPRSFQRDVWISMINADRHTYLILTKRPQNMLDSGLCDFDFIWRGLTVCNQAEADAKIPVFLQVPGRKFLSIEPMLGPVILDPFWMKCTGASECDKRRPDKGSTVCHPDPCPPRIDAVILGGETGPGARPMHPDWVRGVRDQCAAAGVPFFFKSWGKWVQNPSAAGHRVLDVRTHDELPWVKP